MGIRFSIDDALKRGFIEPAVAKEMKEAARLHKPKGSSIPASQAVKRENGRTDGQDPQKILFEDLCRKLPGIPRWEAENLVPGRKFRADIFIAPDIVVEMDGFAYHRSKSAYQSDRDRQNLFTKFGFKPFRGYTKMVFDAEKRREFVDMVVSVAITSRVRAGLPVPAQGPADSL